MLNFSKLRDSVTNSLLEAQDTTKNRRLTEDSQTTSTTLFAKEDSTENDDVPYELPREIRAKLSKLEKYEERHPRLIKAYKDQQALVQSFERALREHTPCDSIGDSDTFTEYLQNLAQRADLSIKELETVTKKLKFLENENTLLSSAAQQDSFSGSEKKQQESTKGFDTVAQGEEITVTENPLPINENPNLTSETSQESEKNLELLNIKIQTEHELKSTKEELENVRDMLKVTGNELVTAKDKIKQLENVIKEDINEDKENNLELRAQLATSQKEFNNAQKKIDISNKVIEGLRTRIKETSEKLQEKESNIDSLQEKVKHAEQALICSEEKKTQNETCLNSNETISDDLKSEVEKLNLKLIDSERLIQTSEGKLSEINLTVSVLKENLRESQEKVAALEASKSSMVMQSDYLKLQQTFEEKEKDSNKLRQKLKELATYKDSREMELNNSIEKTNALQSKVDAVAKENEDLRKSLEIETAKINDANMHRMEIEKARSRLQSELDQTKNDFSVLSAKFDSVHATMETSREEVREMHHVLREARDKAEQLEEELSEARKTTEDYEQKKNAIEKVFGQMETSYQKRISDMKDYLQSAESKASNMESEIRQIKLDFSLQIEEIKTKCYNQEVEIKTLTQAREALCEELKKGKQTILQLEELADSLKNDLTRTKETEQLQNSTVEKQSNHIQALLKELEDEKLLKREREEEEMQVTTKNYENPDVLDREYVKNVLLQYIDLKERRPQLLSAISRLFDLSPSDEEKFRRM